MKAADFKNLLDDLGRDPRLKRVIAKARRQIKKKDGARAENWPDFLLLGLAILSRFASKKKSRAVHEFMDWVYLLVQVSLLLKENIFDRPEVKEFFSQQSERLLSLAQKCVDLALSAASDVRQIKFRRTQSS